MYKERPGRQIQHVGVCELLLMYTGCPPTESNRSWFVGVVREKRPSNF